MFSILLQCRAIQVTTKEGKKSSFSFYTINDVNKNKQLIFAVSVKFIVFGIRQSNTWLWDAL